MIMYRGVTLGIKNNKLVKMKIAIAGTGYVGLSNAMLLSQHHDVVAVDIIEEKVRLLNDKLFSDCRR